MSHTERTGSRDLRYSSWHRPANIKRYVGLERAAKMSVIDIDWCEYCWSCREPVALIETAYDTGQAVKPSHVMANLAEKASIECYTVLYTAAPDTGDLISFRIAQSRRQDQWLRMNPQQYADWLWKLREAHCCGATGSSFAPGPA